MHASLAAALALVASTAFTAVEAIGCPSFDINNVAYLHTESGDYSLGSDLATATNLTALNATGRPSFTGNNTQCFTNQFTNGLYVLGADETTNAYIFNFADKTWSTQQTTGGPSGDYAVILDHDTVVLFAFANGSWSSLSFDESAAKATSAALEWQVGASANQPAFTVASGQKPVLGSANNHIQVINTEGASPGQAYIFVIHFAYNQPEVQSFGDFPEASGQAVTIFSNSSAAPNTFAYIPDDANNTYVIDAKSNTTMTFAAPPSSDPLSRYAASTTTLLQLTSNGTAAYLDMTASAPAWTMLNITLAASSASSNFTTGGASSTAGAASSGVGSLPKGAAPSAGSTGSASLATKTSLLGGGLAILFLAGVQCLL